MSVQDNNFEGRANATVFFGPNQSDNLIIVFEKFFTVLMAK